MRCFTRTSRRHRTTPHLFRTMAAPLDTASVLVYRRSAHTTEACRRSTRMEGCSISELTERSAFRTQPHMIFRKAPLRSFVRHQHQLSVLWDLVQ